MAIHVIQPDRSFQDQLAAILSQQMAQRQQEELERQRLAQQESQFRRAAEAAAPLTTAQTNQANAATDLARFDITDRTRGRDFEENEKKLGLFLKNTYEPLLAAGRVKEAESARLEYASRFNPLAGWAERPATNLDEANANLAKMKADATARVAAGGHNFEDVNLSFKLGTGEQVSAAAAPNYEAREFGPGAVRKQVDIETKVAPDANTQLNARTQKEIAAMDNATRERIATLGATAGGGGGAVAPDPNAPTGNDYLKTLDAGTASLVKAIADYKVDVSKAASQRNPKNGESERRKLLQQVLQYDPTYDMAQYPVMQKTRTDFTSGKARGNVLSLNTLIHHIEELDKAADDLNNTGIPSINGALNFISRQTGNDAVTNFNATRTAVADELATLFKGTAGTDSSIAHWREGIDANMSPQQFKGQIRELLGLAHGRLAALEDSYRGATGKPVDFEILTKQSQDTLKRLGYDPTMRNLSDGDETHGAPVIVQQNQRTGAYRHSTDGGKTWREGRP